MACSCRTGTMLFRKERRPMDRMDSMVNYLCFGILLFFLSSTEIASAEEVASVQDLARYALRTNLGPFGFYFSRILPGTSLTDEHIEEVRKQVSTFSGFPASTNHYYGVYQNEENFYLLPIRTPGLRPDPFDGRIARFGTANGKIDGRPWAVNGTHLTWEYPPSPSSGGDIDTTRAPLIILSSAARLGLLAPSFERLTHSSNRFELPIDRESKLTGQMVATNGLPHRVLYRNTGTGSEFDVHVDFEQHDDSPETMVLEIYRKKRSAEEFALIETIQITDVRRIDRELVDQALDPKLLIASNAIVINVWSNRFLHRVVDGQTMLSSPLDTPPPKPNIWGLTAVAVLIVFPAALLFIKRRSV